jgi:hypothetical protein
MRRLAIFVEGYTELLFVDRIIREIADKNQIVIEHRQIRGGGRDGRIQRTIRTIKTPQAAHDKSLYILIVDCGGDRLVAQRVREEQGPLTKKGYEKIIGMRDVYPEFTKEDIPRLRRGLNYGVKTSLAPVQFVLSVMEIEAWFLAEHNHFPLIDPAITVDAIRTLLGFNPEVDDMSDRPEPTKDIIAAYGIGGKAYEKGAAQSTTDKLDYDYVYAVLRERIPELSELLSTVDGFLA